MTDAGHGGQAAHSGGHGDHGGQAAPKGTKKTPHEVKKEHQDLYDKVIESFDPEYHIATTKKHNGAFAKAVSDIADKTYKSEHEAIEALVDALIKYRKEAKIPVNDEKEHRHHVYGEVRHYVELMKQGKFGDGLRNFEVLYKTGNLMEALSGIHKQETLKNINTKVEYELQKVIPEGEEPETYQGILMAHGNYTCHKFKKGDLAAAGNKDSLIEQFKDLYKVEVTRMIEDKKEDTHGKDHGEAHH